MTDRKTVHDYAIEVWSRLFDHRPFLRSEVKSFVHSIEGKYPGERTPDLSEPSAQLADISERLLPHCQQLLTQSLPPLAADADSLRLQCETALRTVVTSQQGQSRAAELKQEREEDGNRFLAELEQQRAEVDAEFAQKEADLEAYYRRSEQKGF